MTTEDLPFIISDILGTEQIVYRILIKNYALSTSYGLKPFASVKMEIDGQIHEGTSAGDGQYDAFMRAVRMIYEKVGKELPLLTDYQVSIPPGGKTDALVETIISWKHHDKEFRTKGLDVDQTGSAIKATEKMLNLIESLNNGTEIKTMPV